MKVIKVSFAEMRFHEKKKILWPIFFTLFKLREIIFEIAMLATYMQTNFLLDLTIVPKTNFFGKLILTEVLNLNVILPVKRIF